MVGHVHYPTQAPPTVGSRVASFKEAHLANVSRQRLKHKRRGTLEHKKPYTKSNYHKTGCDENPPSGEEAQLNSVERRKRKRVSALAFERKEALVRARSAQINKKKNYNTRTFFFFFRPITKMR